MSRRSSLPFLGGSSYMNPNRMYGNIVDDNSSERMTVDTLGNALLSTFGVFAIGTIITTSLFSKVLANPTGGSAGTLGLVLIVAVIGTLVLALVNSFKRVASPALVMAYAGLEGVLVAAISISYNTMYEGIVGHAVLATFCVVFASVAMFKSGIIAQNRTFFARIIPILLVSYILMSLINFVLVLTTSWTSVYNSSFGIGISAFAIVFGGIMLAQDLDSAQVGIDMGAPAHYSWRCSFGIFLDVIWIYLEVLRLLAILSNRK
ncbi:MAG: Bax inhibitor-1/YccA family protein [Bifidobacteriaceae bacterium]|jgi:uncharacterized YccA/Bax inhibitor family protein|nr:Bax inhibitor-1/YccA family protein [Bifidobacteriaceae bacterium]